MANDNDAIMEALDRLKDWAMQKMLASGEKPPEEPSGAPQDKYSDEGGGEDFGKDGKTEPDGDEAAVIEIDTEPKKPTVFGRYEGSRASKPDEEDPPRRMPVPRRRF